MSVALNLYYKGKNGNANLFMNEMEKSGLADKIRNRKGNECYEFFTSVRDKDKKTNATISTITGPETDIS